MESLRVKLLSEAARLPVRASDGAAGYDLSSSEKVTVPAWGRKTVKTDLALELPASLGVYGRIAPRSGLAHRHGIDVGAGVIDADYRGSVGVVLFNHSDEEFKIEPGDRIAQLILERIATPAVTDMGSSQLDQTARGGGGFGSTGLASTPGAAPFHPLKTPPSPFSQASTTPNAESGQGDPIRSTAGACSVGAENGPWPCPSTSTKPCASTKPYGSANHCATTASSAQVDEMQKQTDVQADGAGVHALVYDEAQVCRFAQVVGRAQPSYDADAIRLLGVFARSKYRAEVPNVCLNMQSCGPLDTSSFLRHLRRFECRVGAYTYIPKSSKITASCESSTDHPEASTAPKANTETGPALAPAASDVAVSGIDGQKSGSGVDGQKSGSGVEGRKLSSGNGGQASNGRVRAFSDHEDEDAVGGMDGDERPVPFPTDALVIYASAGCKSMARAWLGVHHNFELDLMDRGLNAGSNVRVPITQLPNKVLRRAQGLASNSTLWDIDIDTKDHGARQRLRRVLEYVPPASETKTSGSEATTSQRAPRRRAPSKSDDLSKTDGPSGGGSEKRTRVSAPEASPALGQTADAGAMKPQQTLWVSAAHPAVDGGKLGVMESGLRLDMTQLVALAIETRGGYHVLLRTEMLAGEHRRRLHEFCTAPENRFQAPNREGRTLTKTLFSIERDPFVPVPGTLQGGFPVRIVSLDTALPS